MYKIVKAETAAVLEAKVEALRKDAFELKYLGGPCTGGSYIFQAVDYIPHPQRSTVAGGEDMWRK